MIFLYILLGLLAVVFGVKLWKKREPKGWYIGPIVNGKNRSFNMPLYPDTDGDDVWSIEVPKESHPHYITKASKFTKRIHFKYEVKGTFTCVERPDQPASCSLFFQRKGDTYAGTGKYAHYRWYSTQAFPLTEGIHEFTVDLEYKNWINVQGPDTEQNFLAAIAKMARVGIVFGGAGGRGHGARGPASYRLLEWNVV